ncbi:MAG: AbrB/MazE/SpoVT family DNA-binding domain-containing protein [Patescibacteria group bacterium]
MNTATQTKIQKITSKGQITLPIAWRRKVKTDMIMVRETLKGIEIIPSQTYKMSPEDRDDDIIIFNADRDHDGVWMPAEELATRLEKLNRNKKTRNHGSY